MSLITFLISIVVLPCKAYLTPGNSSKTSQPSTQNPSSSSSTPHKTNKASNDPQRPAQYNSANATQRPSRFNSENKTIHRPPQSNAERDHGNPENKNKIGGQNWFLDDIDSLNNLTPSKIRQIYNKEVLRNIFISEHELEKKIISNLPDPKDKTKDKKIILDSIPENVLIQAIGLSRSDLAQVTQLPQLEEFERNPQQLKNFIDKNIKMDFLVNLIRENNHSPDKDLSRSEMDALAGFAAVANAPASLATLLMETKNLSDLKKVQAIAKAVTELGLEAAESGHLTDDEVTHVSESILILKPITQSNWQEPISINIASNTENVVQRDGSVKFMRADTVLVIDPIDRLTNRLPGESLIIVKVRYSDIDNGETYEDVVDFTTIDTVHEIFNPKPEPPPSGVTPSPKDTQPDIVFDPSDDDDTQTQDHSSENDHSNDSDYSTNYSGNYNYGSTYGTSETSSDSSDSSSDSSGSGD